MSVTSSYSRTKEIEEQASLRRAPMVSAAIAQRRNCSWSRNGRRKGLKLPEPQGCRGSIPFFGIVSN